jgi:toxin YoeB
LKIIFSENSWEDYNSWVSDDRKVLTKINAIIKDIIRHPFEGIGKPEPLKHKLSGYWSRRITQEHRMVYQVLDDAVYIISCRYHY